MRCFYCENLNNNYATLDNFEHKHLFSVLRAKPNTKLLLIDGKGHTAEAIIEKNKEIKIIEVHNHPEPKVKVHLYVAPPRKQKMDQLLSQCTEAGVWTIQPIITENSVAIPQKKDITEKWNVKLIEACKQAHNPYLPKIEACISFNESIKNIINSNITAFYGSTDSTTNSFSNLNSCKEVAWFIGPEGGFSDKEIELMLNTNFYKLSLGTWIMRVETAAVVGTSLLQQIL